MKLLLDTHALLWWLDGSPKLGRRARDAISTEAAVVCVSAATGWEIAIKTVLGRLSFGEPPEDYLPREIERSGFQPLSVTMAHALAIGALRPHHADPFDRLLVAQARAEGMTLVTADRIFDRYGVSTLDASR